jgi:hypothetical protein
LALHLEGLPKEKDLSAAGIRWWEISSIDPLRVGSDEKDYNDTFQVSSDEEDQSKLDVE